MKRFFLLVFLFSFTAFSQNYLVDYKFSIVDNKDEYGIIGFSITRLITNKTESLTLSKNIDTTAIINGKDEPHIQEASPFTVSQYKNFIDGKRFSRTLFSKYNLKDENYTIPWKIEKSFKTILGYNCQKATGSYRGRDYICYFTEDIPIQSGPHTFDGLPGLVLEVMSLDKAIVFKAITIEETNEKTYNPFDQDKKEYISWEEFVVAYKGYFEKMSNYKPEEDIEFVVPNRSIEVYFTK